ncbi:hypothetical protein [Acidisoma cladoniae]|jgi:hypothetical protein|uniref:hypothetical protein n=1 Tax=Acidisoma cladoniae TaxID=3040935 RepID=UPI00254C154B|nr:hypothetical protein [Acidisoma sp. PAMC 29798]
MVAAAWNLLIAAWSHALDIVGSPLLSGLASVALLLAFVLVSGLPRERASWFARFGWGLCLVLVLWCGLAQWSAVTTVYQDHVALVALAQQRRSEIDRLRVQNATLRGQLQHLNTAISQVKTATATDTARPSSTTAPSSSAGLSSAHDPDGLYQFGEKVADVTGVRIDRPDGVVSFDRLTTRSHITFESVADFGTLHLQACSSQTKWSELAISNVTVTNYLGVLCKIVNPGR